MIPILDRGLPGGDGAGIGIIMFFIGCGLGSAGSMVLLATFIAFLVDNNKSYRIPIIIGLVLLVLSGISFLLMAVLCGW